MSLRRAVSALLFAGVTALALAPAATANHSQLELASVSPPGNGFWNAIPNEISNDGKRVWFTTGRNIAPEDNDFALDVYERFNGTTRLISTPAGSGSGVFDGSSADGTIVFFSWPAVDGQIYAQPLYVPNLLVGGEVRNVVYVATQNQTCE